MFKKLIQLAGNLMGSTPIPEDFPSSSVDGNTATPHVSSGGQVQSDPSKASNDAMASDQAERPHQPDLHGTHPTPNATSLEYPCATKPSQTHSVLQMLYQTTSLEEGMLCIAESLTSFNPQTYLDAMQQWSQASQLQSLGAIAITAKRQGDYSKAMNIFNDLAHDGLYSSQIHHSTMKVLGASGQIATARRALQLWCVAIIPEKVFRLVARDTQATRSNTNQGVEQLDYLAGWAIADEKSMYHLGSLQMISNNELAPHVQEAYVLTLQGKKQRLLHDPKIAVQRGKELAQTLPWRSLTPVMNTEIWQHLLTVSCQKAQELNHRHVA